MASVAAANTANTARAARRALPRPDRRLAILLAAERLFAQRGYHAVSIRDIAEAAGVPSALVGYYFGPKDALFHAIFEHWNGTIEQRLQALRVAVTQPKTRRLQAIMRAFIEPVLALRASAEGESYALLVARELAHRGPQADRALRDFFDPLAEAFIDALQAALPHAGRADVAWCYQFALGALLHHLSDDRVARLSHGQARPNDPAAAPRLLAFVVGGIRAALPAP